MKRFGRILLWIVFLPLGLWRSLRHGQKKDAKKLAKQMKAMEQRMGQRQEPERPPI